MPGSHDELFGDMLSGRTQSVRAKPTAEEAEAEDLGPCAARATAKLIPCLHVFRLRGSTRSFDFVHLGFKEYDPGNTWFILEFNEPEKFRVTVRGRNLWRIYNYIVQHRLEWIREADRDFAGDQEAIITAIEIESVEEEAGAG